jgi:hypothetical protein
VWRRGLGEGLGVGLGTGEAAEGGTGEVGGGEGEAMQGLHGDTCADTWMESLPQG